MRRQLFFFFCLLYLLPSCIGFRSEINSDKLFRKIWMPILEKLNTPITIPRSHLNEDLLFSYKQEIDTIKAAWKKAASVKNKEKIGEKEFYAREIDARNQEDLRALEEHSLFTQAYSREQLQAVYDALTKSRTNMATATYRGSEQIGFCFGRALLAHYLLLQQGIHQDDIIKIFAFDNMMVQHQIWQFHVAVAVRDKEWGFAVIDTLQPSIMSYKEWLLVTKQFSMTYPRPRMRFYVTDARKLLPASGAYELSWLSDDVLRAYFFDLGREIATQQHKD